MTERVIFHADCNGFFASVELLRYPELRDKPVAVSGSVDDRRGIILAKNEVAKKYNIKTAETVWQAKKKCPALILLPPHRKQYNKYSRIINEIYAQYTDRVEPFGIDESWLDMTGSWQLFGKTPREVADRLRRQVKEETGLTISVGISFNKIFAKMGSDYKKPDATTEITQDNYKQLVWALPVGALLYVGKKARESLAELGVKNIGQLAAMPEDVLLVVLGKMGGQLHRYALGEDDAPVARIGESEPIKSIGNGCTFRRNLVGMGDIRTALGSLADEVASRLREEKLYAGSLQVIIKTPELQSISRQKPLPFSTHLAKDLTTAAVELVQDNWNVKRPIRMLTLTAQLLTEQPFAVQTNLFEQAANMNPKREQLEKSMDKIRKKYGKTSILQAGELHNDIGIEGTAHPDKRNNDGEEEE